MFDPDNGGGIPQHLFIPFVLNGNQPPVNPPIQPAPAKAVEKKKNDIVYVAVYAESGKMKPSGASEYDKRILEFDPSVTAKELRTSVCAVMGVPINSQFTCTFHDESKKKAVAFNTDAEILSAVENIQKLNKRARTVCNKAINVHYMLAADEDAPTGLAFNTVVKDQDSTLQKKRLRVLDDFIKMNGCTEHPTRAFCVVNPHTNQHIAMPQELLNRWASRVASGDEEADKFPVWKDFRVWRDSVEAFIPVRLLDAAKSIKKAAMLTPAYAFTPDMTPNQPTASTSSSSVPTIPPIASTSTSSIAYTDRLASSSLSTSRFASSSLSASVASSRAIQNSVASSSRPPPPLSFGGSSYGKKEIQPRRHLPTYFDNNTIFDLSDSESTGSDLDDGIGLTPMPLDATPIIPTFEILHHAQRIRIDWDFAGFGAAFKQSGFFYAEDFFAEGVTAETLLTVNGQLTLAMTRHLLSVAHALYDRAVNRPIPSSRVLTPLANPPFVYNTPSPSAPGRWRQAPAPTTPNKRRRSDQKENDMAVKQEVDEVVVKNKPADVKVKPEPEEITLSDDEEPVGHTRDDAILINSSPSRP